MRSQTLTGMKNMLLAFLWGLSAILYAQYPMPKMPALEGERAYPTGDGIRSEVMSVPLAGVAGVGTPAVRWATKVTKVSARDHKMPEVAALKEAKLAGKWSTAAGADDEAWGVAKSTPPTIGASFEANWSLQQTPPDNTMAISNGGLIVTANNDEVLYMNTAGTLLQFFNWSDFFNSPTLNANIYDPKVIYDSQADRFIMTILHGSTASNSLVLLCFSQSNDPQDGWWVYNLPGNVLNNNTWFDYPGLGVSTTDVFVTGNLFTSGNNQFNQALIYQLPKAPGYSGGTLNYITWSGLSAAPYPAFTLMPASWGQQGNYGPGMLLVSNNSGGGNVVRIWEITNSFGNSPMINAYTTSVSTYGPAADAAQLGSSDLLDNGDCRIMNAFYLNERIHFVHATDVGGGWNGIRYGRINVTNLQTQLAQFGNVGVADLSYPAVASYGSSPSDQAVIVAFTRSSGAIFPEVRVTHCDASMTFSDAPLVKAGETFVNFVQGTERWGDYTGIARRHNAPQPRVWLAACYGANIPGFSNNVYKTWVAEVGVAGSVGIEEDQAAAPMRLFPNPAVDLYQLRFELETTTQLRVELYDARGTLVKLLHEDTRSAGEHLLSFNRGALASGTYSLILRSPTGTIGHEKLVVQ